MGPRLVKLFIFAIFIFIMFGFAVQLRLISLPPHFDPFMPPNLDEKPYWLTQTKMKALDLNPTACAKALDDAGLDGTLLPDESKSDSCTLDGTVMLSRLSTARVKPEQTRCNIAARLYMWERNVVQPAAQRTFGEGVAEVTHFGSYSCRTIHGSPYMSEHATANAIDISGFRLKSGKVISVLKDWDGGAPSDFLHVVHAGLCDYFNLTLSPDYNADHKDHFHVDMGWLRRCL